MDSSDERFVGEQKKGPLRILGSVFSVTSHDFNKNSVASVSEIFFVILFLGVEIVGFMDSEASRGVGMMCDVFITSFFRPSVLCLHHFRFFILSLHYMWMRRSLVFHVLKSLKISVCLEALLPPCFKKLYWSLPYVSKVHKVNALIVNAWVALFFLCVHLHNTQLTARNIPIPQNFPHFLVNISPKIITTLISVF